MKDESVSISLHFLLNEIHSPKDVIEKMKEVGIPFKVEEILQHEEYTIIKIEFPNFLWQWDFMSKFKQTPVFKLCKEYQEEEDKSKFISSINSEKIDWNVELLEKILADESSWWGTRGGISSWYQLTALLSKGFIEVKAKSCPIFQVPPVDQKDESLYSAYRTARHSKGNIRIGLMNWCAWNWLKEQGEPHPTFPSSLSNVYAEELNISVKVGEGDPFKIISYLLNNGGTYVHIPYGETLTLFIFKGSEQFVNWRKGKEKEVKEITAEIERLYELEQIRQKEKEEQAEQIFIESMQLKNIEENKMLNSEQIMNICRYDEGSPFKGKYISGEQIRSWINSNELIGNKQNNRWYVLKADLEDFLKNR